MIELTINISISEKQTNNTGSWHKIFFNGLHLAAYYVESGEVVFESPDDMLFGLDIKEAVSDEIRLKTGIIVQDEHIGFVEDVGGLFKSLSGLEFR